MRILLSVVGTRGDVQPVVALALRLRALGHDVHLCVPPNFVEQAASFGLSATAMGIPMRAPRPGEAPPKVIPDLITDQFETLLTAAGGRDIIVGANAHQYAAPSIAELLGIRYVNALYAPTALPSDENIRTWNDRARDRVNTNRARLGLSPVDDVLRHIVTDSPWLATDPSLSPLAAVPEMNLVQTGAWMLEGGGPLSPALDAFLQAGDPPIYVGFGSMPAPEGIGRALVDGARAAGRRVIIAQGWGQLSRVDDAPDCIEIDEVDHDTLFNRVSVVVHHGGAGTTHAAARAGVPQVVAPIFGDQPYWAGRVTSLGIGTTLPLAELSAGRVASALEHAQRPSVRHSARALAPAIRVDGADRAARLLTASH